MKLVIRADANAQMGTGHLMRCWARAWREDGDPGWREDDNPAWREHVTPYIRRHPERFETYGVLNDEDLSRMRWTVDTPEDLAFVRRIYEHFGHDQFSWREVLTLLKQYPDWLAINRDVQQKTI
jgi:spore coat polysaccharide biosynthesis protein SpsF